MSLVIDVQDLVKTYPGRPPVKAVQGISLQVAAGQCYGVLGPNGAGKTTTIEILEGLMPATSGRVRVLGLEWKSDAVKIREQIGVSLQETQLSDKLSVREIVQLFRSFYTSGISVSLAIEMVGLQEKSKAWVKKLSGGQKQRLAIACSIVGSPRLLFLDEPTTGLDPTSRRQLWEIIRNFREDGRTILLTTHYMEEAERLCDRVAIIDRGHIIAEGSPRDLIASLGAEHVIEVQLDDASGRINEEMIKSLPGVENVELDRKGFKFSVGQPHEILPRLIQLTAEHQIALTGLATRNATLEDVFISLTGRHLQDDVVNNELNGDNNTEHAELNPKATATVDSKSGVRP